LGLVFCCWQRRPMPCVNVMTRVVLDLVPGPDHQPLRRQWRCPPSLFVGMALGRLVRRLAADDWATVCDSCAPRDPWGGWASVYQLHVLAMAFLRVRSLGGRIIFRYNKRHPVGVPAIGLRRVCLGMKFPKCRAVVGICRDCGFQGSTSSARAESPGPQ